LAPEVVGADASGQTGVVDQRRHGEGFPVITPAR